MDLSVYLHESAYVDFSMPNIIEKAKELFRREHTGVDKARIAYEYVRDEIRIPSISARKLLLRKRPMFSNMKRAFVTQRQIS